MRHVAPLSLRYYAPSLPLPPQTFLSRRLPHCLGPYPMRAANATSDSDLGSGAEKNYFSSLRSARVSRNLCVNSVLASLYVDTIVNFLVARFAIEPCLKFWVNRSRFSVKKYPNIRCITKQRYRSRNELTQTSSWGRFFCGILGPDSQGKIL